MTDMARASGSPYLTRRSVLAGVAAGSVLSISGLALEKAEAAAGPVRRELSFDDGWLFFRGAADEARGQVFDDSSWRRLDLPHDYSIEDVPGGSDDGGATAEPSNAINIMAVDQATSPSPPKIGPMDIENTPGGPTGPAGGRMVGYTTNGEAWYRKHFTVPDLDEGDRVELQFDGAYCYLDVWLNGNHLGFVPNGYIPFHFDLTTHLRRGEPNVMTVRVRNTGQTTRWYSGSGIYRHTRLVMTKGVRIPRWGVVVTTPDVSAAAATMMMAVRVDNHLHAVPDVRVRSTVFAPGGRRISTVTSASQPVDRSSTFAIRHRLTQPALWDLDRPNLHTVRTEILVDGKVTDDVTERVGVRSIEVNAGGFLLNGRSIKMRGGNIHHDHGPLGAVAPYRAEERRIQLLKAAGFNAVRSSHNCPNPLLLDVCDRLGMLVYDEFTDVWDDSKMADDYHQYFPFHWPEDLQRWVSNGMNHPSVVIRSTGNEIGVVRDDQSPEQRYARSKQLADTVRRLDPTRPVTQGGASNIGNTEELNSTDHLDIGSIHYQHDYSDLRAKYPNKPFVQCESHVGTLYDDWKLVTDNNFAIGDFTWTAWDYIGEAGIGATIALPPGSEELPTDPHLSRLTLYGTVPYPWYTAGCGDLDLIGQRRGQNLYRNVVWGRSDLEMAVDRPTPGLQSQAYGWSWFDELESWTWDVLPGQSMRVRAYSSGDKVELLLNGISVASKTLIDADQHIATFDVPYTPGTLVAIAYRAGEEIARKTLRTVGAPAALRLRPDRQRITTSRDDLAYVVIEVVDAHGNLVPDAVVKVEFDVTGGEFVGVANGNPHNVDSFTRPRRWTYHGRALAVVQPPHNAGTIVVNAFAADLRADTITIDVVDQPYPTI